jgi:hypothetical protein
VIEEEEISQVPDAQDAEHSSLKLVEDNLHKSGAHTEALEGLNITEVAEKGADVDEKANKDKKELEELKKELVVQKKEVQSLTENAELKKEVEYLQEVQYLKEVQYVKEVQYLKEVVELKKEVLELQKIVCEKLEKENAELKKEVQCVTENTELQKVVYDLKMAAGEKKKEVITESKLETELKKINQEMDKVTKALENIKVRDGAPRSASPVIPPRSCLDFGNTVWKQPKFPTSDPAEEDSDEIGANTPTTGSSIFDDAGSRSFFT